MDCVEYAVAGKSWCSGVWLNCRRCYASGRIIGSSSPLSQWPYASMAECGEVFLAAGWSGRDVNMFDARCPFCQGKN